MTDLYVDNRDEFEGIIKVYKELIIPYMDKEFTSIEDIDNKGRAGTVFKSIFESNMLLKRNQWNIYYDNPANDLERKHNEMVIDLLLTLDPDFYSLDIGLSKDLLRKQYQLQQLKEIEKNKKSTEETVARVDEVINRSSSGGSSDGCGAGCYIAAGLGILALGAALWWGYNNFIGNDYTEDTIELPDNY